MRYTDHPDTAELAKGVREEANDAWQRLFKQKIADEEAAEKEKKRALALGAKANETIAQIKTFFIFYRLADYCAEQGAVFGAEEAEQLESNIKAWLDTEGIPEKMRDEAWEAVEVGWASANIERHGQYELKANCTEIRETVMGTGLLRPVPTQRRKNPF